MALFVSDVKLSFVVGFCIRAIWSNLKCIIRGRKVKRRCDKCSKVSTFFLSPTHQRGRWLCHSSTSKVILRQTEKCSNSQFACTKSVTNKPIFWPIWMKSMRLQLNNSQLARILFSRSTFSSCCLDFCLIHRIRWILEKMFITMDSKFCYSWIISTFPR